MQAYQPYREVHVLYTCISKGSAHPSFTKIIFNTESGILLEFDYDKTTIAEITDKLSWGSIFRYDAIVFTVI